MYEIVGDFGEDKDAAAKLREESLKIFIEQRENVTIDFEGVTLVTQSFIHALISNILRTNGEVSLEYLEFRNCNDLVRGIISTVVQYSLDTINTLPFEQDAPDLT
ncbi:MAG: STAS-like domain-containing protein [Geminicoccaceae bacterium]